MSFLKSALISLFVNVVICAEYLVDPQQCLIWGPGLKRHIVLPVRYFFVQAVDTHGQNFTESLGEKPFLVKITDKSGDRIRTYLTVLDRGDGVYIVRFRLFESPADLTIRVTYEGEDVAHSPYTMEGMVYHETCYCPAHSINKYLTAMECPSSYRQIDVDLLPFPSVDVDHAAEQIIKSFNKAGMHSLVQYRIIDNQVYRRTYGEHVGFKIFSDNLILSLTRKVYFPNMEFFINLGDWPLEKNLDKPLPILSWCGSEDTADIVMPTYDITEATLEMMSRVSLDILSVQANTGPVWENKTGKAFWRGRDSRRERLDLVVMARKHPDVIDAALTNMFFFPKDEAKYGKLMKSISFFDFFKFKYQINVDGTVAAYRLPYLLAGDSVVLKQESDYYEHFYHDLRPWEHFIPYKRNLSDLLEKIQWAKDNDNQAKQIAKNAQQFVRENLMPRDIICYYILLLKQYATHLKRAPVDAIGFELVEQANDHNTQCDCKRMRAQKQKDEL